MNWGGFFDEMEKIATPGLMNEPTIHKKNLKRAVHIAIPMAAASAAGPLIHHYYSQYRPNLRSTLARSAKRGAIGGTVAGLTGLGILEAATFLSKKRRDASRARIEARQAARRHPDAG